jgi:hypothetical protein
MGIRRLERFIYIVRGKQVMFDRDLAKLYGVTTGRLNEQVQRNMSRFPEDFMFQMTPIEQANLISQFAISSSDWGGHRKPSRVFTQEGVAMLSGVLNSPRAIEVNVSIMRAFVRLRRALEMDDGLAARMERAEAALAALDLEQGEQAAAIHAAFAAIRGLMRS